MRQKITRQEITDRKDYDIENYEIEKITRQKITIEKNCNNEIAKIYYFKENSEEQSQERRKAENSEIYKEIKTRRWRM